MQENEDNGDSIRHQQIPTCSRSTPTEIPATVQRRGLGSLCGVIVLSPVLENVILLCFQYLFQFVSSVINPLLQRQHLRKKLYGFESFLIGENFFVHCLPFRGPLQVVERLSVTLCAADGNMRTR